MTLSKTEQLAALEGALDVLKNNYNLAEECLLWKWVADVAEALRREIDAEEMVNISDRLRKQFGAGFKLETRGEASS